MAFSSSSLRRSLKLGRGSRPGIPHVTDGTVTYGRRAGTMRDRGASLRPGAGGGGGDGDRPKRASSLPAPASSSPGDPFWSFSVYATYVKVTNKIRFVPGMLADCTLPYLPNLKNILAGRYPNFRFTTTAHGGNLSEVAFLAVECPRNPVRAAPTVVRCSLNEIAISLMRPLEGPVPAGGLTFYLLPVTLVKPHGLYLKIQKDRAAVGAATTCSQDGAHLNSEQPQVFFSGTAAPAREGGELPFLLAQRTPRFERGGFCKVHVTQGVTCPVNAVKLSKHYVRLPVCELRGDGGAGAAAPSQIKVGVTLVREAMLAFRYNPYLFSPWCWAEATVPIHYYGPPVIVPAGQAARVVYGNVYYAPMLDELTAVIAPPLDGDGDRRFGLMGCCEWPKGGHAELAVENRTCFLQVLRTGDRLGDAIFFIAPRIPMVNLLPARYRENLSVAVTVVGGVTLNASKLHKISELAQPLASQRD
ncbi:virion protein G11 [Equid gammaherpesvirus 2]|nr:virion protein G11 [Equid gammaherpesvirus 2]